MSASGFHIGAFCCICARLVNLSANDARRVDIECAMAPAGLS